MYLCAVRIWLPDEPGALGSVASRIGVAGGDVLGIEVLERGAGRAVDELIVALRTAADTQALVREVGAVGGVDIEELREVATGGDEPDLSLFEALVELLALEADDEFLSRVLHEVVSRTRATWGAIIDPSGAARHQTGAPPAAEWLHAFAEGASATAEMTDAAALDVCRVALPSIDASLLIGRDELPFRERERRRLAAVAGLCDARLALAKRLASRTS